MSGDGAGLIKEWAKARDHIAWCRSAGLDPATHVCARIEDVDARVEPAHGGVTVVVSGQP
jgi:hypothetical protein